MTIDEAVQKFTRTLPGWWWTIGLCSISADASCGPDRNGPDADLLAHRLFDSGFHADLSPPATPVDALMDVLEQATAARSRARDEH